MIAKIRAKMKLGWVIFGLIFAMINLGGLLVSGATSSVYAVPETTEVNTAETEESTGVNEPTGTNEQNSTNNTSNGENTGANATTGGQNSGENSEQNKGKQDDGCKKNLGIIGWLVCPTTGKLAEAVDWLYSKIEEWMSDLLVVNPLAAEDGSPIYEVWKYARGLTNIVFIIFLLVVVYSQLTGLGLNNYGIKKALPKLIVAAILVNLSFLICALAIDVSNILGNGIHGFFNTVKEETLGNANSDISFANLFGALSAGNLAALGIGAAGAAAGAVAFELGYFWLLIPIVLGAIVAVVVGFITIALRQAVVMLLVMVAPLAFVAYMLPNTERWFKQWRKFLTQMLVFYPAFSLLFGASNLAGFAIILGFGNVFGVILGLAVMVFPLFFAVHLMKMSGTFLGGINTKLRGLANTPLAANRAWADSHRAETRAYRMQYGKTPFSRLQRKLDDRKEARAATTESLMKARKNDANVYIQKRAASGYDGTKARGTSRTDLKPNKYTRIAKDLANSNLASERATKDTTHVISNYGDYFVDKEIREDVRKANKKLKSGDAKIRAEGERELEILEKKDKEYRRAATGAKNFLELYRAEMTARNDDEADLDFAVDEFLAARKWYNPDAKNSDENRKYEHLIVSSGGGLGENGATRVLGRVVAQAKAVENDKRKDIAILAQKFPHMKEEFRSMQMGYLVDDNGYAVDKNGNKIEDIRGSLMLTDPDKLVTWDKVDEQGRKYYDWYDGDGKFVTRVFDTDRAAFKELFSNQDAPINDPINNLWIMMAGTKRGSIHSKVGDPEKEAALQRIGLHEYKTTIGPVLEIFKEKNAAYSPMVAAEVARGYIKNPAQLMIAYMDSFNKSGRPSNFNVQDSDAVDSQRFALDPNNWPELFKEEWLRDDTMNVNGELMCGYKLDQNGEVMYDENDKPIKIPQKEATYEELMACVKEKYIIPFGQKAKYSVTRQTQHTLDNQKPGVVGPFAKMAEVFNEYWGEGKAVDADPDALIKQRQKTMKLNRMNKKAAESMGGGASASPMNYHVEVDDLEMRSNDDAATFIEGFRTLCNQHPGDLARVKEDFEEFIRYNEDTVTIDEVYNYAVRLLDAYT